MENEVNEDGNSIAFENRVYDPRVVRWFSLDPLQKKYPSESHYAFVSCNPIYYADKDGRDKIITITIIGKDGSTTEIRRIDKSYFKYGKDGRMGGAGYYYWKADVHQNITINLIDNTSSVKIDYPNKEYITGYEYSQLSEWVDGVVNFFNSKVGDNSDKYQYGWRIYGKGHDGEWQKGLPKPPPGSDESIDLGAWLDIAEGMREGEQLSELAAKLGLKKTSQFVEKIENVVAGIDGAMDAVENSKKISAKKSSQSTPVVVPIDKTVYTKNGYKYPSEGGLKGGTVSESKDSSNANGDTTYRVKTVYKKKKQ